jgi:hypothetical protein
MKRHIKLTSQSQQAHQQTSAEHFKESAAREFATVEDMLRHDCLHTPVPPAIAHRLQESLGQIPAPQRPWWRRLFGS